MMALQFPLYHPEVDTCNVNIIDYFKLWKKIEKRTGVINDLLGQIRNQASIAITVFI